MLPRNASQILLARQRDGMRPDLPVIVSFVGSLPEYENPKVFADPGVDYDWRFLFDLEVLIVVRPGIDCKAAIEAIFAVARLYPTLVDIERKSAASILETKPYSDWPITRRSAAWKELFA